MAQPRFYCSLPLQAHSSVTLPDEVSHYALRVLRLRDGASIILFDGRGGQFEATLQIHGKSAHAAVGAHQAAEAELPGKITLIQGLPSGDKMDWIIEKSVELGADCVVPIAAQRSVVQLSPERQAKRLKHWQRIAQSASEQCGRNRLMKIAEPVTLEACLDSYDTAAGPLLLCHPEAGQSLPQAMGKADDIALLVGPEGGWSPQEHQLALKHAAQPLQFGPRVLRTETAGLALIAAISALRGWN